MPKRCAKMNEITSKYYVSKYLSNNSKYKAVSFIEHFFTFFKHCDKE